MLQMTSSPCDDISEFLDTLKKMRVMDDKIAHALNTSIPTESFASKVDPSATCKDLFTKLVGSHHDRDNALQSCINVTVNSLQRLKEERDSKPGDIQVLKKLRKEQSKLRELQTEVNVEEVIRGRTLKLYHERCRNFYKPQSQE